MKEQEDFVELCGKIRDIRGECTVKDLLNITCIEEYSEYMRLNVDRLFKETSGGRVVKNSSKKKNKV